MISGPAYFVKIDNKSILKYGDYSVLSLSNATKVFTVFEGGAIISKNKILESKKIMQPWKFCN